MQGRSVRLALHPAPAIIQRFLKGISFEFHPAETQIGKTIFVNHKNIVI